MARRPFLRGKVGNKISKTWKVSAIFQISSLTTAQKLRNASRHIHFQLITIKPCYSFRVFGGRRGALVHYLQGAYLIRSKNFTPILRILISNSPLHYLHPLREKALNRFMILFTTRQKVRNQGFFYLLYPRIMSVEKIVILPVSRRLV